MVFFVREGVQRRNAAKLESASTLDKAPAWKMREDIGKQLKFQTNLCPDIVIWTVK
jgi:hypothetical protein